MILFYLLVVVMPLSEHQFWARDLGGNITPFKILGAACILYALATLCVRNRIPPTLSTLQARIFVALFAVFLLQAILNPGPSGGVWIMHWVSFLLLLAVVVSLVTSVRRLFWTTLAAVASIAVASAYVVRFWQKYHGSYEAFRTGGAVGDPNYYSLAAICFLPLAIHLAFRRRNTIEKVFYLGCAVLTLGGLACASSRGGFLGLAAELVFLLVRSPHRLRNLALGAAVMVPLGFLPGSPLQRLVHPAASDQIGSEARLACWQAALRMMADHPVTGIGPGAFKSQVAAYQTGPEVYEYLAHNTYLELGAELGIPFALGFVALLVVTYGSFERTRRLAMKRRPFVADLALAAQAGLVGCSVGIFFLTATHQKCMWLLVFLSIPLRHLARRRRPRRAQTAVAFDSATIMPLAVSGAGIPNDRRTG